MSKNKKHNTVSKDAPLDVCILTSGRYDLLAKSLDAVYAEAQSTPLNIYILENGVDAKERIGYEHLLTYQAEKDPAKGVVRFQTKRSQTNTGFPVGSNEVARMGRSPLIMFLGDDVELRPGAIRQVLEDFNDQTIGIVGIKLLFPLSSTDRNRPAGKVQHVGMAVNIRGEPIHPLIGWSAGHPKCNVTRDAWAVTGACFSIRRNLFQRLGGFDPIFGLGTHEDLDLCLKVRQAGHRVYLDVRAVGYHYVGATAEKLKVAFPIQQNRSIFISHWQNSGQIFWNDWEYL